MNQYFRTVVVLTSVVVAAACGSKGPPLPPLRPVPAAPTAVVARRVADRVTLRMVIPAASQDVTMPLTIAKVEIYARTLPAGAEPPTLEQLVRKDALVGTIEVRPVAPPAPAPGSAAVTPTPTAPAIPAAPDSRPAPGELASWSETVSPQTSSAVPMTRAQQARATARRPVWAPIAPTGLWMPFVRVTLPTRYYVALGVSDRDRPGPASPIIAVPFGPAPEAPAQPTLSASETTLTLTWTTREPGAPVTVVETNAAGEERPAPVQEAAITTGTWSSPVAFDVERCFVVRRVLRMGAVSTESATAGPVCSTPKDTFPPPAPGGLIAPPSGTTDVTLLWDAVTAPDLAGYHVLRGEGSAENMQQITTELVTGLQYPDSPPKTGVRYFYAVIAVDKAGNPSAQSNRVQVQR